MPLNGRMRISRKGEVYWKLGIGGQAEMQFKLTADMAANCGAQEFMNGSDGPEFLKNKLDRWILYGHSSNLYR